MWVRRIGCGAEEQATRTRVLLSRRLLWIHGRRCRGQKASWCSHAHFCRITSSIRIAAAV
jgi:hypothetical protein